VSLTLKATSLMVAYGDLNAVWDVSFTAEPGKITVILGRNGAGKSTTLLSVAGLLPLSRGSLVLGEEDISHMAAHQRVRSGVSLVAQGNRLFRQRTVEENLRIGTWTIRRDRERCQRGMERAYDLFPQLAERRQSKAGNLSGGQQQMLAISQALISEPKVLLLDEPSAGLAPVLVQETFAVLQRLKSTGLAVVLVEQLLDQVLPIADSVVVIDGGRTIFSRPRAELDERTVRDVYLGTTAGTKDGGPTPPPL
jgi:branched-chain amino acid transport system ATP-binding protein